MKYLDRKKNFDRVVYDPYLPDNSNSVIFMISFVTKLFFIIK